MYTQYLQGFKKNHQTAQEIQSFQKTIAIYETFLPLTFPEKD